MQTSHPSAARSTAKASLPVVLGLLAAAALQAAAAGSVTEVRPGSVVRWPADATSRCAMAGESWAPIEGVCWFPVDLLAEGTIRVERVVGGETTDLTLRVGEYPYEVQRIRIADDSKVHLSAEDAARAERESGRVAELWALRTPRRFTLPLGPPLARTPAGGRFGARRFFNGVPRNPHTGVDYSVPAGTPVLAVAPGRVALAEDHFFSGKSVFVDHGDGLVSMYFHLSEIAVAAGDEIAAGQRIGKVGATGRATGPHLHFGLRWRGARVDPARLLEPPGKAPSIGG